MLPNFNIMRKLLFAGFMSMIVVSMAIGVSLNVEAQSELKNLVLSTTECLANDENTDEDDWKVAMPHDCSYTKKVYIDGLNQVVTITVPGKEGICDGAYGPCNSWSCTEILN